MKYTHLLAAIAVCLAYPASAWAYIGPGSGLTVIGAALTLVASVVVALVGFVWYPLKRLMRRATRKHDEPLPRSAQ